MERQVEIKITEDNTEEAKKRVADEIPKILTAIGLHLAGQAGEALEASPHRVDTGLLRNSVTFALSGESPHIQSYTADKPNKKGELKSGQYSGRMPDEPGETKAVYIGTNVEYAPYVHEGHRMPNGGHVAANRFLKNAIEWNAEQIKRKFREYLDEL